MPHLKRTERQIDFSEQGRRKRSPLIYFPYHSLPAHTDSTHTHTHTHKQQTTSHLATGTFVLVHIVLLKRAQPGTLHKHPLRLSVPDNVRENIYEQHPHTQLQSRTELQTWCGCEFGQCDIGRGSALEMRRHWTRQCALEENMS
jgi:hypothetical protein